MYLRLLVLLLLFTAAAIAAERPVSKFTSTAEKDSVVLEQSGPNDEIDSFKIRCKGFGGYEVLFEGGDSRSWINLKHGNSVTDLYAATMELGPGHFPNKANDVIEWRGMERAGKFVPYAIIYRISGVNEETQKSRTRLLVIKLDKENSAIVGHAEGKDEDAKAKKIADGFRPE